MYENFVGTWETVRNREVSVLERCPHGEVRLYYHIMSEVKNFYWTFITNCVFNSFLSYTAIMLNVVTIHAIRKISSLPETLKALLMSLAVSDVGVGLLVQPFYTSVLVRWMLRTILVVTRLRLFCGVLY